jgi:hypothetical protein
MKEYIELAGKKYRIEFNWNTITDYCEIKNITDLSALDSLASLSPGELRQFLHCAIKEGERMDGRELEITAVEFGGMLKFDDIQKLMQVFQKQSSFPGVSTSAGTKKKKRLFF